MANWWEMFLGQPSTTAPLYPKPPFNPYIPAMPGQDRFGVAGLQEYLGIPSGRRDAPNTFRPGATPGEMVTAPQPPLPPGAPPPPRNFAPAASPPMMGQIPPDYGSTFAGMPPGAPPATPSATPTPAGPNWFERNKEPIDDLSSMLLQTGAGMLQAPPGASFGQGLGQGLGQGFQYLSQSPDRKLDRRYKQAQIGEVEAKGAQREGLKSVYADKSLPMAVRLAAASGDYGKFLDAYMKLDPDTQTALNKNEAVKAAMVSAATFGDRAKIAEIAAGKAPAGYRWGPDGKLETIPGGPATHISADVAGRLAMTQTAMTDLAKSRNVFLRDWSTTDIANAQISAGEIGRAQRNVTLAIEAALRSMTGAAAPDTEVRKYEGMFMPKSYDTKETRAQKLKLLESFMQNSVRIATQGRGDIPSAPKGNNDPLGLR